MNAARKRAFAEKWAARAGETLFIAEDDEPPSEPPLSRTNPRYSGRNLILDGGVRIEPKGHARWITEQRVWAVWGYRWNRQSRKWSDLRLHHCRGFELEDEPI